MKDGSSSDRRPDSQQLIRQWAVLRLLADAKQPYTVKQLAEQLDVSKATIERDLATLERDFAVVEESVGKQKKAYRIDQKIRALETLTFGTTELLALYAAQASLSALSGTPRPRGFALGPGQDSRLPQSAAQRRTRRAVTCVRAARARARRLRTPARADRPTRRRDRTTSRVPHHVQRRVAWDYEATHRATATPRLASLRALSARMPG